MTANTGFNEYMGFMRKFFETTLPVYGFSPREKQIELAEEIFHAMNERNVILAEAEVGTGKTLAYLLPAVLTRRARINESRINTRLRDGRAMPIVIATSSIALQKAIITDYIPMLSRILLERGIIKTPLTAALRKGKGNYLCERRLKNFFDTANQQTRSAVAPLLSSQVVDLASVRGLTSYMKRNICVVEQCNQNCRSYGSCRYNLFMREVNRGGYDFQVVNHNLFLADITHRATGLNALIPDYQAVILDEGHKFLDVARDMYGTELSLMELYRIVRDIRGFTFEPGQKTSDLFKTTDRIYSKSRLLFQFLNKEVPPDQKDDDDTERCTTKIRERTSNLMWALKEDFLDLEEVLKERYVIPKYRNRYKNVIRATSKIIAALAAYIRHNDLVYWLEEGEYDPSLEIPKNGDFRLNILKSIPKNLGALLYRDLWSKDIPIILTSGTLSAAGSFDHMKRKTGLDHVPAKRLMETSKPSPFDHKNNAMLYISENTPFPDNGDAEYIDAVADEVERLIETSHGHAAVLFTSYKAMDMVHERISSRKLPYPVFRLDRGGSGAIEQFKRSGNGVLFASGAIWEGIDIPGDILSMLIIVRLPFAVPDPISEWERTLYDSMDEYKAKVVVPEMLIKLKQGFGRLIRTITDTGVVAILDSRVNSRGAYRRRVLETLPPCRLTSRIGVLHNFLRKKKPYAYFGEAGTYQNIA